MRARSIPADSLGGHARELWGALTLVTDHGPKVSRVRMGGHELCGAETPLWPALTEPDILGWGLPLREGPSLPPSFPRPSPGERSQTPTQGDREEDGAEGDQELAGKDGDRGGWREGPPRPRGGGRARREDALVRDGGSGYGEP